MSLFSRLLRVIYNILAIFLGGNKEERDENDGCR